MFSKDLLKHLFDYHSDGHLINRHNRGRWKGKGKPAGSFDSKGYARVSICGKRFLLHRLIWIYHNGEIPDGLQVDHIDRDTSNNRIENLRLATHSQNMRNRDHKPNPDNPYIGVQRNFNRWRAMISINNQNLTIGTFESAEDARAARSAFEKENGLAEWY